MERQSVKFKGKITKTLDENFKTMFKIFKMIYDTIDLNQNIRKINILFHLLKIIIVILTHVQEQKAFTEATLKSACKT